MTSWAKENVSVTLRNTTTGELETDTHVVKLQPTDEDYDTGAITCTQLSTLHTYTPESDLDADTHYWIYVDDVKIKLLPAFNSRPQLGE